MICQRAALVLLSVESVLAVRKRTWCCDDDDDDSWLNNVTSTNTTSEEVSGLRLLWNRRPSGKDQREKECPCEDNEPDSLWDQILSTAVIVVCVLVLLGVLYRSVFYTKKPTAEEKERQDLAKAEIQKRIAAAKEALIPIPFNTAFAADANCAICLDSFSNDRTNEQAITPVNCVHQFHRACIEQWLDTALNEAEKITTIRPINTNLRHFSCPTCAQSMLPLDEEGQSNSDVYDSASLSSSSSLSDEDDDQSNTVAANHQVDQIQIELVVPRSPMPSHEYTAAAQQDDI